MNDGQPLLVGREHHASSDAEELRGEALGLALLTIPGLVLVLVSVVLLVSDAIWREVALTVPALGAVAAGANLLRRRSVSSAAAVLCAGLTVALAGILYVLPSVSLVHWFALVVILTSTVLGQGYGFLAAAGATGAVALTLASQPNALSAQQAYAALLFVWVTAVLSWMASRPVNTALAWAWSSYVQSLQTTRELRERQGELNHALKSLNETNYRLERANLELARARAAADEARRLKAEFAANISHELRTPLNLIIGFSEMMAMAPEVYGRETLPVAYREDVNAIYRNARHLGNLVDDVLDLSQLDAGRMGLTKEWTSLGQIISEAVETVKTLVTDRGLWLKVDVPAELPSLCVDRTRVRQVLINLLNNAARFTQRGGVTVTARCNGTDVVVQVADTGVGIAPEDVPNAFEEFRQLDGSTRRRQGGSGLGLAISKRFIELHGGNIWAESQLGGGSTFCFSLPVCENVAGSILRREWQTWVRFPHVSDQPEPNVAVVSEDPAIARIFQRYLDGYRVLALGDGRKLHDLVAQEPVHAIIVATRLDVDEPPVRRLGEVPKGVPLIACSLPSRRSIARQVGVDAYLVKPVSRERVVATLKLFGKGRRTLLVVDDDPEMVHLLARMIHSASKRYQVLKAYSGAEALDLLRQKRPDGVILDLVMPDVDGYAVVQQMAASAELRDIPVVAVTARGYEKDTVAAGVVSLTREGGLSISELMRCLRASLGALLGPTGTAPEPQATAGA